MTVRDPEEPGIDSFRRRVVALANKTAKNLTGQFSEVQAIVDAGEVVMAVWQDANEPTGVGMLLIKGHQSLREMLADGMDAERTIAAIPCVSFEQAQALRQVVGEQDKRH